jgi:hypothetical protein
MKIFDLNGVLNFEVELCVLWKKKYIINKLKQRRKIKKNTLKYSSHILVYCVEKKKSLISSLDDNATVEN